MSDRATTGAGGGPRIIKLPEVLRRTGHSRSVVYDRIKRGAFPKPIRLGAHAVGFIEREIDAYIAELIDASRAGQA